jgi:hypothetical protein
VKIFFLANSATTHTILKDKKYFQQLILRKAKVNTISGSSNLIEGFKRANIMLPKGTKICIDDALYSSKSYFALRIYVIMAIILKPIMKALKNISILLQ